jgi:glycosyltransferase involved in cell wall biosynthesis
MFDYAAVIPAHNEAARIATAIRSILGQSLPPQEVIVVDDGSTDGTAEVAGSFQGVQVVRLPCSEGAARPRNVGTSMATSNWVAFLDGDDWWDRDKIERQAVLAESSVAGVIYCGARICKPGRTPLDIPAQPFPSHYRFRRMLLLRNCVRGSASAVLVRRDLLQKSGGFDETLPHMEDYDMWIRLSQVTTFACVPEPLVNILSRTGSKGSDPRLMYEAGHALMIKHDKLFSSYWDGALLRRRARGNLYAVRGGLHWRNGNCADARRDFIRAASIWPFQPRTLAAAIKSLVRMAWPAPSTANERDGH